MKKLDIKVKFAIVVVLTLSILALGVRLYMFPDVSLAEQMKIWIFSFMVFSFFVSVFFIINNLLDKFYPYSKSVAFRIIMQISFCVIIVFLLRSALLQYALPHAPVQISVDKFFRVAIYFVDFFACLSINLAFFSEHFFKQWKMSFQKAERLEKEKAQVQYDNLKNKLNPHFLFNALTSLNSLIYENQDQASDFLKQLSKVYRYLLQNNDLVTLEKEMEFVNHYASLLQTRFGKSLKINFSIKQEDKEKMIVPVTIQSLIENALKHNIISEAQSLTISVKSDDGYIIVENNLQKKTIVESSNKQGLKNLESLYQYISPLRIEVAESDGKFIVKVPLLNED